MKLDLKKDKRNRFYYIALAPGQKRDLTLQRMYYDIVRKLLQDYMFVL